MKIDWLLIVGAQLNSELAQKFFVRLFEMSATYLVQSTLILCTAWLLLRISTLWRQQKQPNPLVIETTWKLAALLPLMTTPICVSSGWSLTIVNGSLAEPVRDVLKAADQQTKIIDREERSPFRPLDKSGLEASPTRSFGPEQRLLTQSDLEEMLRSTGTPRDPDELIAMKSIPKTSDAGLLNAVPTSIRRQSLEPSISNFASVFSQVPQISIVAKIGMVLLTWIALCLLRLIWKAVLLEAWLRRCTLIDPKQSRLAFASMPECCHIRFLRSCSEQDKRRLRNLHPFACGLFRWTIVLPHGIEKHLNSDERQALLTHEIAHLVRRDPIWQWLGQILCTCFAFQPLNFFARRQWRRASELLCDDWAIDRNVNPTSLARCLTKIAEWQLNQKRTLQPVALFGLFAVGHAGSLTTRIEWLLRPRQPDRLISSRLHLLTIATAVIAGLLIGMCSPRLVVTSPVTAINPLPVVSVPALPDHSATTTDVIPPVTAELKRELSAASDDLIRLQVQVKQLPEPEFDRVVNDMHRRVRVLQRQLEE